MIQKSYNKSENGVLYIVPTPIGNIKDITLRAINTLKEVDVIYAEDTRTSSILLQKLEIKNILKSCHMHNEKKVKFKIIQQLKEKKNIALISDQGTPLLSDPGFEVIELAIKEGMNVVALPGASAILPALNMSGIEANRFLFYGFLNSKESIAKKELENIKNLPYTIAIYESPHRFTKTLQLMIDIIGNRHISICREISKIHEEVFRGTIFEALNNYEKIKGEIVIIIEKFYQENDIEEAFIEVKKLVKDGFSNKDAVKMISEKYGVSKNLLYNKNEESNR